MLGLFSGIMGLTALVTLLIPETKGKTLEDIESDTLYGKNLSSSEDFSTGATNTPVMEGKDGVREDVKNIQSV